MKNITLTICTIFIFTLGFFVHADAATIDVDIVNFAFDPTPVVVCTGDTVRWTNQDTAPHTSTSDTGVWDSGTLTTGQDYSFTFTSAGTYDYHCAIHPSMTATVEVIDCTLTADTVYIFGNNGSSVNFDLMAGTANMGRNYLLLGSVSGTSPGTLLPGGLVTIPLNRDWFTDFVLDNLNNAVFQNFWGTLDASGNGSATLSAPPIPTWIGRKVSFAYALKSPWDFASNAITVEIVP